MKTCHYPDLDSAFDWLKQISLVAGPIESSTQIWIVACHQYGICAGVPQTSFRGRHEKHVGCFLRLAQMQMAI